MERDERQRYEYNVETARGRLSEGEFEKLIDQNANYGFRLKELVEQDNGVTMIFERPVE